ERARNPVSKAETGFLRLPLSLPAPSPTRQCQKPRLRASAVSAAMRSRVIRGRSTMSRTGTLLAVFAVALATGFLAAQPKAMSPDPKAPRPIDGIDTVFVEEMTWMEVRDALKAGKTTVIVATGGVEQNGPYLATGKHDIILR